MSALAPYVDFYIEAAQQNRRNFKLDMDPELFLALQELSELTDLARGLNHIMAVTKKRIDETVEGEKLVIWITAKDVEQAVENVTEENLQNEDQEKIARKQAKKEERERIASEEKEELERRAAEDAEREKRRLALEEDDEDSDENSNGTGLTAEDERRALRRARDRKKKLTMEDVTLDTIELTPEESARYQAEMAANDNEEQFGPDAMEFVDYTPEQNAGPAEQDGEEETPSLSAAAGSQAGGTNTRGTKRARVEDAENDAEDESERTSKRVKTTPDEVDESDSQSTIQNETASPEQQQEDATPAQPAKKRTRKWGKKRRQHKPERTQDAASAAQREPHSTPDANNTGAGTSQATLSARTGHTKAGASDAGQALPSQIPQPAHTHTRQAQSEGPVTFEDNSLAPTFLAPEALNLLPIAKTPIPEHATVEERIATRALERAAAEHRAHAHREMARSHMENAKSRDISARGKKIEREIRVLELAQRRGDKERGVWSADM